MQLPASLRGISRRKLLFIALALVIVLGGLAVFTRYWASRPIAIGYSDDYVLLPDKVAKSAALVVRLPKGIPVAEAAWQVSFEPNIQGAWVNSPKLGELVFQPAKPLPVGNRFVVKLNAPSAALQKEFLVEEDPKVAAVFPNQGTEANEFSNVTLVFNRPMVPLSSLGNMESAAQTAGQFVSITPATPGRFRWVTTKNLQFEPTERLHRASTYTIKIKDGFKSIDGLAVPIATYTFTTRPLRYETVNESHTLSFDEPLRVFFNQPVDLTRTPKEISLTRSGSSSSLAPGLPAPAGISVPFTTGYGKRTIYDSGGSEREVVDERILEIRPAQDKFGRAGKWDFGAFYTYSIQKAYPKEGDLGIDFPSGNGFSISPILASVTAESPRSTHVSADMFDPQGKLILAFAEAVDKDSLKISGAEVQKTEYGEECQTDSLGNQIWVGSECKKQPDRKTVKLSLNPNQLASGTSVTLKLDRIVNSAGAVLNAESVPVEVKIYPELRITKTNPDSSSTGVEPTGLDICSTTPLTPPEEKDFSNRFRSSLPIGRWSWPDARRIEMGELKPPCAVGEFYARLAVGLAPKSSIHLELHPLDDFGRTTQVNLDFTTAAAPESGRNFFALQGAYQVTSPSRTNLTYAVENLNFVDLSVCEVRAETMLKFASEIPDATKALSSDLCVRTVTRHITLPDRYWTRNYFQVKLSDLVGTNPGHFILTFTNPDHRRITPVWNASQQQMTRQVGGLVYERSFVTLTNLAVAEKRIEWQGETGYDQNYAHTKNALAVGPRSLYWVSAFGTLAPVPNASVTVYGKDQALLTTGTTGTDGIAETDVVPGVTGVIVRTANDSALVSENADRLNWASSASSPEMVYIYSDRPIYRPGDEVNIKGIHRIGFDGNYEILAGKQLPITIFDGRGGKAYEGQVTLSDQGTFTLSYHLNSTAPLGSYSISVGGSGYGNFEVEEYQPAPFEVKTAPGQEEYRAGDTGKVMINANYYFGVPVEGGSVTYSVTSQDYYFDRYQGPDFDFGQSWYQSYNQGYGDKFLTRGETVLDSKGQATVSLPLDFGKLFTADEGRKSKILSLELTAKNKNGQAVTSRTSFIVHRGDFYLGLNLTPSFSSKGEPVAVKVKSVDKTGQPLSVSNLHAKLERITWQSFKRREVDGRYYYTSEQKRETVSEQTLATNGSGDGGLTVKPDKEGEYELTLSGEDAAHNPIRATHSLYVYGSSTVEVKESSNEALDIVPDKSEVKVGGELSAILKSPFPSGKALVTLERGKIFEHHIVDIVGSFAKLSYPVKPEYVPNVTLSAVLLSPRPDLRFGQVDYTVGVEGVTLTIEAKTDKTVYLPGEKVHLTLVSKDVKGQGTPAELSVAVADLSVLALKGNPKKNPVVFFYGGSPLTVTTATNVKNVLYEAEVPTGTKGGGGGGEAPGELAKKKRGEFKDTALWQGVVQTDRLGRGEVTFTLPDNLTTWQVESVGVTLDTKVGVGYAEFKTRKDLMVVPLKPRFLLPGDSFSLGAKVFNQTDHRLPVEVSIHRDLSKIIQTKSLALAPGATETVYFKFQVPVSPAEHSSLKFTISGKSGDLEDTVEQTIPIAHNQIPETVSTAGYTVADQANEYLLVPGDVVQDQGGAKLQVSGTLAVFISDALKSLLANPYFSSEQISAQLAAIAVVDRGVKSFDLPRPAGTDTVVLNGTKYPFAEAVPIGLAKLSNLQTPEGGFAYYPNLPPDFYLTREILDGLTMLPPAGYTVPDPLLQNSANYLAKELTRSDQMVSYLQSPDTVISTAYTLSHVPGFVLPQLVSDRLTAYAADLSLRERLSSSALLRLAMLGSSVHLSSPAEEQLFKSLENRVQIDGRGASIVNRGTEGYDFLETPVNDTALFIKASALEGRDSPLLEKTLRWLFRSRDAGGGWGSARDTLTAVDSLTDYLTSKHEANSNFSLAVELDNAPRDNFEITPSSILSIFQTAFPLGNLVPDKVHSLALKKTAHNKLPNGFYYDLTLKYFLPVISTPPRDEGFTLTRNLYRLDDPNGRTPITSAKQGEVVRGHLTLTVPEERRAITLTDFIPAGTELINFRLDTSDKSLLNFDEFQASPQNLSKKAATPAAPASGTLGWLNNLSFGSLLGGSSETLPDATYAPSDPGDALMPDNEELHDDRLFLFRTYLSPGVYQYDYFLRALVPGEYSHLPASVSETYFPEIFGRTPGSTFRVDPGADVISE